MTSPSLKTIARAAGVSKTTASFVLNGKGDKHKINKQTQERILKIAEEQNYRPSFLSQVFSSGKTKTIGLVAPHLGNAFTLQLVQHISDKIDELGFRLLPAFSKGNAESELRIVDDFKERHVEAFIAIYPTYLNNFTTGLDKKPTLFIDHKSYPEVYSAQMDLVEGVNLLLQHHIQRHRKAIGFIDVKDSATSEIAETYQKNYLDRFGINAQYSYSATCFGDVVRGLTALEEKKINALLFASPQLALRAMRLKREGKINLPDNIDVSCVGWMPELDLANPKITGLQFDQTEIVECVAQFIRSDFKILPNKKITPSLIL